MFNTLRNTSLPLSLIAFLGLGAVSAHAQPEMDRCGRDITSGPLTDICAPFEMQKESAIVVEWVVVPETTGSISQPASQLTCRRHSHDECDVE